MLFQDAFPENILLNPLEKALKNEYLKKPELRPDLPCSTDAYKNMTDQIYSLISADSFRPSIKSIMDEDTYFPDDGDTVIYQHLRYLPAYLHTHSFIEMIYVISGSCTNHIQDEEIPMQTGDICILAPGTRHAVSAFHDDCIALNFLFRTDTFQNAFFGILSDHDILADFFTRILYHSPNHPYLYFKSGNDTNLQEFAAFAYEEFLGRHEYRNRMLNNIVSAFFTLLLRRHGSHVIIPDRNLPGPDENIVLILKYMQANFRTITLQELSAFSGYSTRQLQRMIKCSTGLNFSENIQKLKMSRAGTLLRDTDLTTAQIAEELGYQDVGSFRSSFKKYWKMLPGSFRTCQTEIHDD